MKLAGEGDSLAAAHVGVIAQALSLIDFGMVPIEPQPHQEEFQYDPSYHSLFLGNLDAWWSHYEKQVMSFSPGIADARQMAKVMLMLEHSMRLYEMLLKKGVEKGVGWLYPKYSPLAEQYLLPPDDIYILFDVLPLVKRDVTGKSKRRVEAVSDDADLDNSDADDSAEPPRKVTGAMAPRRK